MARVHLVVPLHGYDGSPADWHNAAELVGRLPGTLPLLALNGNTHDGIEAGAARIFREVEAAVQAAPSLRDVSVVGHSLGGLYGRVLARLMLEAGLLDRLRPRCFVTFASPHLGIRRPQDTPFNCLFQTAARLLSRTTRELSLQDAPQLMLELSTQPRCLEALARFERRVVYANVFNDLQVPYSTAAIRPRSPYRARAAQPAKCLLEIDPRWGGALTRSSVGAGCALPEAGPCYTKEPQLGAVLERMLLELDRLGWERYDCVFSSPFAHIQIIWQFSLLGSLARSGTCVRRYLLNRPAPTLGLLRACNAH